MKIFEPRYCGIAWPPGAKRYQLLEELGIKDDGEQAWRIGVVGYRCSLPIRFARQSDVERAIAAIEHAELFSSLADFSHAVRHDEERFRVFMQTISDSMAW